MRSSSKLPARLAGAIIILVLLVAPKALCLQEAPEITGFDVRPATGEVELATSGSIEFGYFPLSDPDRLVFDFPGATLAFGDGATQTVEVYGACFTSLRLSQFSHHPPIVRLVLYLAEPAVAVVNYSPSEGRLLIQAEAEDGEIEEIAVFGEGTQDLLSRPEPGSTVRQEPSGSPYEIASSESEVVIRFPGLSAEELAISQLRFPDRLYARVFTNGSTAGQRPRFDQLERGNIWNAVAKQWTSFVDRDGLGVVDLTIYLYRNVGYTQSIGSDGVPEVRLFLLPPEEMIAESATEDTPQTEILVSSYPPQAPASAEETADREIVELGIVEVIEAVETVEVIEHGALISGSNVDDPEVEMEPEESGRIASAAGAAHVQGDSLMAGSVASRAVRSDNLLAGTSRRDDPYTLFMHVGEVVVLPVVGMVRASLGNPTVATLNVISQNELLVTALAPGSTTLLTWETGRGHVAREINVLSATTASEEEIQRVIGDDNIMVSIIMSGETPGVVLEGVVLTEEERLRAGSIAALFAGEQRISNLIEVTDPRQVLVKVRVVEIDKRALDEHLSYFSAAARTDNDDFTIGIITDLLDPENPGGGLLSSRVRPGIINGEAEDMIFDPVDMMLSELESHRDGTVLSEPNLVTMSGHPAHFRVGGEIPYTYQNENGFTVVDFREFGISLDVTPTVDSYGNIKLTVNPVVRTIDWALAIAGIPGFRTREMTTEVQLRSGDTLVLGGLIQHEITEIVSRVPILSEIPVLGKLFQSTRFSEDETELVIFLTPYIIEYLGMSEEIVGITEDGECD